MPDLVGYLLDALSDDERRQVEAELARRPELALELARLRAILVPPMSTDELIEPPSDLAVRTIEAARDPVVVFGQQSSGWSHSNQWRIVDVALVALMLLVVGCLILPAIASMRGDESRLRCADNLRQIGIALDTYQTIEGGQLPVVEASGPMGHAGVFAMLLQARELVPDVRLLVCPMADSAVVYVPRLTEYLAEPADSILQKLQAREMAGSYGYSLGYVDDKGHHAQHPAGTYSPVVSDRPPRAGEPNVSTISPNHLSQGQNVLFADGHVRWLFDARLGNDDLFRNSRGEVGAGIGEGDICIGVSEAVPFPALEATTNVPAK